MISRTNSKRVGSPLKRTVILVGSFFVPKLKFGANININIRITPCFSMGKEKPKPT